MRKSDYPVRLTVAGLCLLAACSPVRQEQPAVQELPASAPDQFKVRLETSKGDIVLAVNKQWAPIGTERFYKLVKTGYYDNAKFFRVVSNFVVQWGINGDPKTTELWSQLRIPDDATKQSNKRGYAAFASRGPNTRTTHVFINLKDNPRLDKDFAPFAVVSEGMDVVDKLYSGYGNGPNQKSVENKGNAYLEKEFPRLDFIQRAKIE